MRAILIMLLVSLAASFATAGTPDRSDWKKAWTRARRGDTYPAGLVAYYSFDSVSGTNVYDTFGSNDGTAEGTPLFDSAYGKYLDGVNLNGSSQWINMGAANPIQTLSAITVSAWINTDTLTRGDIVGIFGSTQPKRKFVLLHGITSAKPQMYITDGSVALYTSGTGAELITTGTWHHVVGSFVNSTKKMEVYLDGKLQSSGTSSVIMQTGIVDVLNVGRNTSTGGNYFDGSLDEIAIWNRALSSNEVSEIYNDGAGRFYTP